MVVALYANDEGWGEARTWTLLKRSGTQDTPHRAAAAASIVIGWAYIAGIQGEVVHTVIIAASRRPEVAVATLISRRARVEDAGEGQRKS